MCHPVDHWKDLCALTRWHVPEHVVARQVDVVDDLAQVSLEVRASQVLEVVQGLLGNISLPLQFSCGFEIFTTCTLYGTVQITLYVAICGSSKIK